MTAEEIKTRLRERRVTQADIADRCKVRTGAVNQVIQGRSASRKIEKAIARAIGVTLAELRGEERAAQ